MPPNHGGRRRARRPSSARLSPALESARARFKSWRTSKDRGHRIPDELWDLAISLVGEFTAYRVAKSLGLDFSALKKRLEKRSSSRSPSKKPDATTPAFREHSASSTLAPLQSVVEIESASGTKIRVQLSGADSSALANFLRDLLREER